MNNLTLIGQKLFRNGICMVNGLIIQTPARFTVLAAFILFAVACGPQQQDVERLEQENEELRTRIEQNAENVETYFSDLNEIENNLRLIKERESIITGRTSDGVELGQNQQDRINEDIKLIGDLMEKNRVLIANLNSRLRNADTRIAGFESTIERLNKTIEEKEIEISLLRDQLANMNFQVDMLTAKVDTLEQEAREKSRLLQQQTIELNTAYYAIGSRKELTDNRVISREGGFLGIGRTERMKADFNHDFFTRIDITRDFEITIIGDRPQIISTHPDGSYQMKTEDGERWLEITNPEAFWSASRYLVIQIR
ncbi:MAG: hypothetical protein EA361_07930 [Bacteroidetes bacterium]|nr:MAG: hypothetical protein EA361_07930 [Bacteroidota bacterium]